MISAELDFRHLKRIVSIEQVLLSRGIRLRRRGDALVGPCPLHGGDNPAAFVVSLSKNLWHCFTGCNAGGDVVELVRRLDQFSYLQVAEQLAKLSGRPAPPSLPPSTPATTKSVRPFTKRLPLDPTAPLLANKGIDPHTAQRFEVGAFHGRGMLARCVAVRLHDPDGRPLGYAGRRLEPKQVRTYGKWRFPPRLPKSTLLYGWHHARTGLARGLVLVECPWGVLRLAQLRIPAVALLGTHLSAVQHDLLLQLPRVLLMMDGDTAGRKAAVTISRRLVPHVEVITMNLSDDQDPDDLSDEQLLEATDSLL